MRHPWPDERATNRKVQIHQSQGCRSGGGAVKAIELTWGGLRHVPLLELGKFYGDPIMIAQESAEGIVGRAVGKASEAFRAERRSNR
jgi:hypothetical protein